MGTTKKNKKVFNGLIYIVMLVLIGVLVYQNHQIRKLSDALNSANETIGKLMSGQDDITQKSATRNTTSAAAGNGQSDFDDLEYQLKAAEEELEMAHEQLADELARKDESANNMMQGTSAMLQTPEGKKRLRNALKNGFDRTYSVLFKELNFSPEKIDQVKELLADQQVALMELDEGFPSESPTVEDVNKHEKSLQDLKSQNEAELEALLGSEDFHALTDYKDRSRERSMIRAVSQTLSYDDTLTGDQKKSLLESLYQKRKDTYSQQGFDEENVNFPLDTNDDARSKFMEMNVLVYDGYIKGVEEAGLSESQEKQLKEYLEERQAGIKSSIERQARIASGQTDPDSTEEDEASAGIIMIVN